MAKKIILYECEHCGKTYSTESGATNCFDNHNITYKCKYCEKTYSTEKEAMECLNNHDIVFGINVEEPDHDCWGNSTSITRSLGKLFKTYESAKDYLSKMNKNRDSDYEITFLKLS